MFSPMITGRIYILSVSCVSADEVQVAIHRRKDVLRWLEQLNHEGANWDVWVHEGSPITRTEDITQEIEEEYCHAQP